MTKKQSVYLTHDGVLVINGKEYVLSTSKRKKIDGIEHIDKTIFKEFDKEEFEKRIGFIVEKIKDSLDKDEIIKELLKKLGLYEVNSLYTIFKKGKKKKITKQEGCLGLKIGTGKPKTGGAYLQLIE